MSERVYNTDGYKKHKEGGWGSRCPGDLPESPQSLLDSAIPHEGDLFNVSGKYALRARTHRPGRWHGHPIPWTRLPTEVRKALVSAGRLTDSQYWTALRQQWGKEYGK